MHTHDFSDNNDNSTISDDTNLPAPTRRSDNDSVNSANNDDEISIFSFHDDDDLNDDISLFSNDSHNPDDAFDLEHSNSTLNMTKISISVMNWLSFLFFCIKSNGHTMCNLPRRSFKALSQYQQKQNLATQEMIDNEVGIGLYNMEAWDKDLFTVTLEQNASYDHLTEDIDDMSLDTTEEDIEQNDDLKCTFSS